MYGQVLKPLRDLKGNLYVKIFLIWLMQKLNWNIHIQKYGKKGYIVVNPEGRRTLILFNSSDDRTSTQYARYLLAVKLGRFLNDDEQVDHKDNDKTNDALGNLQILSKQENIAKSNKRNILSYEFECCICHVNFTLTGKQLGARRDKITPTCSKGCGYKKVAITLTGKIV